MAEVKRWLRPEQRLEVDGGIDEQTAGETAAAGADIFVAGTAIFRRPDRDYAAAIGGIRGSILRATGQSGP
jgi:ribulose-phosphate 3-epimerase